MVTGSRIHFWDDMWCSDVPFLERMGLFIGIFILLILSRNGSWRVYNLSLLYCIPLILIRMGLIKWCGSLQRMDLLMLNNYHRALMTRGSHAFPWKSIWRWKLLLEWLILLGQAMGRILTLDNLRRNIYIVNRCCMCKNIWESVGHLLLCCFYAYNLWTFVFSLSGVSWVMPKQVVDLLACWNGGVGDRCWVVVIWGAIPQCIMWTILWEHNLRTFNGEEHSIIELKWFFLLTLFDWMTALSGPYIPSFWEFLDLCSFT